MSEKSNCQQINKQKEKESLMRDLLDSYNEGFMLMTMKGEIVDANSVLLEMLGYSVEELQKLTERGITPEGIPSIEWKKLTDQLQALGLQDSCHKSFICKDGIAKAVTVQYWIIEDDMEKPFRILAVVQNTAAREIAEKNLKEYGAELQSALEERIREAKKVNKKLIQEILQKKQIEQERLAAESELKEQQAVSVHAQRLRSLGELAAGITHQLNHPLMGIRVTAEHLEIAFKKDWNLPKERILTSLTTIIDQTDRMKAEVDKIRMFASRDERDVFHPVDVNELIEDSLFFIKANLRPRGMDIVTKYDTDLPVVKANRYNLEEALLNLVSNAGDAVLEREDIDEDEKKIVLRTRQVQKEGRTYVRIEIEDNGIGIADDIRGEVFSPFFTTKSPTKGTGLGLSIAKRLINEIGGEIYLESVEGEGTTAIISIPASTEE